MTTHIFVHLSSLNFGQWFRLDLKPHQIPKDVKKFCEVIMQTPDPALVDKDRGGIFTAMRISTLAEVNEYMDRFITVKRARTVAQERPTEAETEEIYDRVFPKTTPPIDDRIDEIIAWIIKYPDKRHVVACRTKAGVKRLTEEFIRTDIDVDARHFRALETGTRFDAATVWFSAAFTVTDQGLYARLSSRLHGSTVANYNIKTRSQEPQ